MKVFNLYIQLIMIFISSTVCLFGQTKKVPIKFWGLQNISGTLGAEGEYKLQDIELRSTYSDELESSFIRGQLLLNTRSYFYHPNLISLETELEYNPGTKKDVYLVLPDRSDINTGERARGLITFLRTQPVIVTGNLNYAHLYTNREYATNLESYNTGFGGAISYRNNFAPISISYQKEKIDQKELQTDRDYLTNRENVKVNTEFSFGDIDEQRLTYNFDDYERKYFSSTRVRTNISSLSLNSNFDLDSNYANNWNSNIYYSVNNGDVEYNRLQINENLNYELQSNFIYSLNYNFFNFSQSNILTKQHSITNKLEHQLYESLNTSLFYEYINTNQNTFEEIIKTGGLGISYTKKIPGGLLNLSYDFRKRNINNNNLSPLITVLNEKHSLRNDRIILLDNPYIDIATIRVKDETGTIFYQEFLDYLIIKRAEFTEIQRVPGGLIAEGGSIYIDYLATSQPSFEYAINTNIFNSRLSLFNNLFEVYFRLNENSYDNVVGREATFLKSISQRIYGSKFRYDYLTVGIEFDDYNSNVIPYEATRYFLTLSSRLSNNLSASLTGNLKLMELIKEKEKQKFHDLSSRLIYNFSRVTQFNLEASYRFQEGRGLDLDLSILRGELKTQFRAIYLTFGIEGYNRKYIGEKLNYWGSFIRIERKF